MLCRTLFSGWKVLVVTTCSALVGVAAAFPPIRPLAFGVIGGTLILVGFTRGHWQAFLLAVLTLPFTQSPTLKVGLRLRFSEVMLLVLAPFIMRYWKDHSGQLSRRTRATVVTMTAYTTVTLVVGLVMAFLDPSVGESSSINEYFGGSPVFRVLVETSRSFAAVIFVVGAALYTAIDHWGNIARFKTTFIAGGVLSGAYALYVAVTVGSAPLLPGTLVFGGGRVASTFFEPTGLGAFMAMSLFLVSRGNDKKPSLNFGVLRLAIIALFVAALLVSTSRTGMAALVAGVITSLVFRWKVRAGGEVKAFVFFIAIAGGLAWLGSAYINGLPAEQRDRLDIGGYYADQAVGDRIEGYAGLVTFLAAHPAGVGQGNYNFLGGGAPGMFRLAAEGGIPGIALLVFIEIQTVLMLKDALRSPNREIRKWAAAIVTAHVATIIVLINYIYTTDVWLWTSVALVCALDVVRHRVSGVVSVAPMQQDDGITASLSGGGRSGSDWSL